jgi:Ni2+-binding GTPase involved in maturation of urease and hydrogenase
LLLIANKSDLFAARAVFFDQAKQFAAANGFAAFVETSAKTGEGIDSVFALLADAPANGVVEAKVRGDVISLDRPQCC